MTVGIYMDQTFQQLQDRINHHIPRCIRSNKRQTKNLPNQQCKITSTPTDYCNQEAFTRECAKHYNNEQFSILATVIARSLFHFSVVEVIYINSSYSLFFANKKNLFIHSQFHINFLCTFRTIVKQKNFDQSKSARNFLVIFAALFIIITTHCLFQCN